MAAASGDVDAVLQEALAAQEHEDEGDVAAAAECYARAASQLSYLLDLQVEQGSALGAMCQGLLQMYEQRVAVLRARQEATKGTHWLQLDQLASSGAASTAFGCTPGPLQQQQLRLSAPPPQQQQQAAAAIAAAAAAAAAAGSEGLQQVYDEPSSPSSSSAASLELLRSCQRSVSGSLCDVVGLESVKEELEEAIFLPLQYPQLFKGIRQPARTFLLHGAPGTGKTLVVEKVAAEAGFMLLSVSPSLVLSKWSGDSEKAIRGVFELARSFQPCIIFLDEVDSLGQSRGSNTDAGARRLLTELLIQFTHAAGEEGVYVFGATNRMQDCDPALLRRFSRRIEVPLPDAAARAAFFAAVLSRPEIEADLSTQDVEQLARLSEGYSGSDLADVCRTAALAPVRDLMRQQRVGSKRRRRAAGGGLLEVADCGSSIDCDSREGSSTAAGGRLSSGSDAQPAVVQLRKLVAADFQAALSLVRPAAADAAGPEQPA